MNALNDIMRELENADDDADDSGIDDFLDDFVSTAAAKVLSSLPACVAIQLLFNRVLQALQSVFLSSSLDSCVSFLQSLPC